MHVYIIKVSVLKTEEGFLEKIMEKHVLKKFYGLTSPEFDRENYYGGSDLGLSFEKDKVILTNPQGVIFQKGAGSSSSSMDTSTTRATRRRPENQRMSAAEEDSSMKDKKGGDKGTKG